MSTATVAQDTARGWVKVFRAPPFYLVGVLPFALGTLIAVASGEDLVWAVWVLGSVAVALIMAMTFLVNEYFDFETDSANVNYTKFSGGSRSLPQGLVDRRHVLIAAGICTLIAAALGAIIQFGYKTGPLTLPFGIVAAAIGYAYTGRPFRLIYRGLGELLIGISVGWMPVFIGYYLLAGMPEGPFIHLLSLPIAASIVNVIVINEYSDYESDKASGKRNLVVALGRERGAWVYAAMGVVTAASLAYLGRAHYAGWQAAVLLLPAALSLVLTVAVVAGAWKDPAKLEKVQLGTILLNLSSIVLLMIINWP
ncbi:MAG: prenyltransferase [Coriobacteriia bacterium]|nr:prenyltransferase [Coriobacteriia bacterium]